MESPAVSPIRPVPHFYTDNANYCSISRKKQTSTPNFRKLPPRPPMKSINRRSRIFRQSDIDGPQVVSFNGSDDSDILPKHVYDSSLRELYFYQCFDIKEKLGSGSFGDVYKVNSKLDGQDYAVKVSRDTFRGKSDRESKLQEVAKHEQLPKHANLVEFYKAWEEKQRLYIQTELCDTSLEYKIHKHHNFPENIVWNYLADLLMALEHLHKHELVHLDIKPENIFITKGDVCKLGDFGLVVDLTKGDVAEATEGDPKYMAKELMQGKFSKAADIFSLGISILELACDLELPTGEQGWHVLRDGTIPFSAFSPISLELQEVITSMMQPHPNKRPTATQLLNHHIIKKIAKKRRWKSTYCQASIRIHKFFFWLARTFYVFSIFHWISSWIKPTSEIMGTPGVRERPFFKPLSDTPNIASFDVETKLEQSFSDDDVFISALNLDVSDADDEITIPNQSSLSRFQKLKLIGSPRMSTPKFVAKPVPSNHVIGHDSPAALRDSIQAANISPTSRHSLCDFSDDDHDSTFSESTAAPKNLLSVFESMNDDSDD